MQSLLLALTLTAAPAWQKLPMVHDWFGVYLQGKKVGYMETDRSHQGNTLITSQRMLARVAGMGQTVEVQVTSQYTYDWASGKLEQVSFEQSSPTGAVAVKGKAAGDKLE